MIVGDWVGVGVPLGSAEAVAASVGMAWVGVATKFNEASDTFSGEVCGLHAPSMKTMIRNKKVVHVCFKKSPVLFWLVLPVYGPPVYQKKSYVALNFNIDKTRRWILISKYHGGKIAMWCILPYLPKFYLEASKNNNRAWIWRDYNQTEECVIP